MTISKEVLDELLKGCERPENLLGDAGLMKELKINHAYISRVLPLTILAPDIVEAIMDGGQVPEINLDKLMEPFPLAWFAQHSSFRLTVRHCYYGGPQ